MDVPPDRVLEHMVEIEKAAEDILADKQQLVDLDRRRQHTRQALRELHKEKGNKKQWVCFGNQFIKLPKQTTKTFLDKDFNQLEDEINKTRMGLKSKMNKLQDLENKEDLKGFNLTALSRDDMSSLNDLL